MEKVNEEKVEQNSGNIFAFHLLMDEMCDMPNEEFIQDIMDKYLGGTDHLGYHGDSVIYVPREYNIHLDDGKVISPQLMFTKCLNIEEPLMTDLEKTQLWNCKEGLDILEECKYEVLATDVLGGILDYKKRANMLVNYVLALMEIYPNCKAVLFDNSKKMLTRDQIVNCNLVYESRFIYYAVNIRYFTIQGTNDMIVDSIGMNTLGLPDLQYHFHDLDPNLIINHALFVLSYIYDNNNPIKSNDFIDGIKNGEISMDVSWKVDYEESLLVPYREVIDVNTNEFASGNRE